MKLLPSCRDITALVLLAEEQALSPGQRLSVRLHMLICKACPRFQKQLALLRKAGERWRNYSEE